MPCKCRDIELEERKDYWYVNQYKQRSGVVYNRASKRSTVACTRCHNIWRTAASYVEELPRPNIFSKYLCRKDAE